MNPDPNELRPAPVTLSPEAQDLIHQVHRIYIRELNMLRVDLIKQIDELHAAAVNRTLSEVAAFYDVPRE